MLTGLTADFSPATDKPSVPPADKREEKSLGEPTTNTTTKSNKKSGKNDAASPAANIAAAACTSSTKSSTQPAEE